MRKLKVRVYDIDGNKMSAGFDLELLMQNEIEIEFPDTDESLPFKDFLFFRKEYGSLLLFTGFKDKSGKEIYEGDVFGNEILRCVVERQNDGAYILRFIHPKMKEKKISILDPKVSKSLVIGNIYEHPHLLNPPELHPK